MNRLLISILLLFFWAAAFAGSATDTAFANLSDEYISDLANFSPVNATLVGEHSADDELDHVDAAARALKRELILEYIAALRALDIDEMSRANQVDAQVLANQLDFDLWSLDVLQEWASNPLQYINTAGSGLYGLFARDFAPLETRLMNAAARLSQMPRFLQQSRAAIQPSRVPKIHAETAVQQNRGLISIIDTMIVPNVAVLPDEDQAKLLSSIELARDAIFSHQGWLENELLPKAAGNFRIGAELYDAKLAFTLDSALSRKEITARAEEAYELLRNEMYEVAKGVYLQQHPYTRFPDRPDGAYKQAIIRAALEEANRELPQRDAIVATAKEQLQQATDFVVEKNLVAMPEEPVEIIIMPEFQRGISVAYLDPPGPLDRDQPAFYAIAPLPADWTEGQIQSFLREYNLYSMQILTLHESVPGHYLQLAHSNQYPSALRSVLWSGPFVEGWGVYAQRMMVSQGYLDHDPLMKLVDMKLQLRSITNAIIDSAIHVDGMTRESAMNLMIEGGFQEEREAAGKWVRAQLSSAQLSTYFVGYQEHIEMRTAVEAAWGSEFTLRRYHDTALSFGSPPVKYVRALILDEAIPRRAE